MTNSTLERDPRLVLQQEGVRGILDAGVTRLRTGDLGSLPVVVGLIIVWVAFQTASNGVFFNPFNIEDLSYNISYGGLITLGIIMVLLIGEIDLSVGSLSGLCASVVAVLNVQHGWNSGLAVIVAIAVGAFLGALQGWIFDRFAVPSFVVTLAGLLAFYGLQLRVLGSTGTITINKGFVADLIDTHYGKAVTYTIVTVTVVAYVATMVLSRLQQDRAELPSKPWFSIAVRGAVVAIVLYLGAWELNRDVGISLLLLIFLAFCVFFGLFTTRTTYGRHVFAVGGNIEAARRAGINVSFIRISVFAISGAMAAIGGIGNASYVNSASQSSGGNQLLLFVIAAAVIGGTSLFGGRGSAWAALLGWLVVGSIQKGIFLINLHASAQNLIVGGVLLAAAVIDAVARRGRQTAGKG